MHRKPIYLQAEQSGRERWLISYTDIVTVLLVLFVAAAAQGLHVHIPVQAAPARTEKTPAPPAAPVAAATPVSPQRQNLIDAEQQLRQDGLDPRLEQRGLVVSLPQAILFASGDDKVATSAFPILAQIAEVVSAIPNKLALVGHPDSQPIYTNRFHNNWELSAARSLNLLALLTSRYGIPESRLSLQSYGSNDPKTSNDTEAGRAENRRVEILILDDTSPPR